MCSRSLPSFTNRRVHVRLLGRLAMRRVRHHRVHQVGRHHLALLQVDPFLCLDLALLNDRKTSTLANDATNK